MAGIPEGGIRDFNRLENWLNVQPLGISHQYAQTLVFRLAARAAPLIHQIFSIEFADERVPILFAATNLRALALARVAALYPDFDIELAATAAAEAWTINFRKIVDVREIAYPPFSGTALAAAGRASGNSVIIATSVANASRSQYAGAIASTFSTSSDAPFNQNEWWQAISEDAWQLERSEGGAALKDAKLWPTLQPAKWKQVNQDFQKSLLARSDENWEPWVRWYICIVEGANSFGLPDDLAKWIDMRMALGGDAYNPKFWEQEPTEINRQIKEWVDEAQAAVTSHSQITSVEQLKDWQNDLPEKNRVPFLRVISHRAALRSIPLFQWEPYKTNGYDQMLLATFGTNVVTRAVNKQPTPELRLAAVGIANFTLSLTYSAISLSPNISLASTESAARCADSYRGGNEVEALVSSIEAAIRSTFDAGGMLDLDETWRAISADINDLMTSRDRIALLDKALWLGHQSEAWNGEAQDFQDFLIGTMPVDSLQRGDPNWQVWEEWFDSRKYGAPAFGLTEDLAESVEKRMALGGNAYNPKFWEQEPTEINRQIKQWVDEARAQQAERVKPVFISYNSADENAAKEVNTVVESIGLQTFAQFKDMPVGSSLVVEMQSGLTKMGKFTPIYSPDYLTSDICQDEWNAAYNMDRGGRNRLIVGFVVKPCVLLPLQKQVVYRPLYGLTKQQARIAITEAFFDDGTKKSPTASRIDAASYASPEPEIGLNGRLGISASNEIESPFIDDELTSLPASLRALIDRLLASLPSKNAPIMVSSNLNDYKTELLVNGASPRIVDLIRCKEVIEAEIADACEFEALWYRRGIQKSLEQFLDLHERLRQRFPMVMLRDIKIVQSSIDPNKFDDPIFAQHHKILADGAIQAEQEAIASEEFRRVMELRERQRKDIASLRESQSPKPDDIFLSADDRIQPADIKKRFLFDISGTSDKMLERTANVAAIADSSAGKLMISATRELLKLIWGG